MITIFIDGACSGNGTLNAIAGWGLIATDGDCNELAKTYGKIVGKQTNNRAEITSLLKAIEYIADYDGKETEFEIKSDSRLVVECATGRAKKNANTDLWELVSKAVSKVKLKDSNIKVNIIQVPREQNIADSLAKQGVNSLF